MTDFRQKQEDGDLEFRRGLEELVRGHVEGCMTALASCSSAADDEDDHSAAGGAGGGDVPDLIARRRRRSDLEGDDLAESSAAARRHSRILSRWVARQAEEMITTIERRNRENELMALAGLHTVSMLDSSFLHESRRAQSSVERPVAARASSILQRWRELEYATARDRRSPSVSGNHRQSAAESRGTSEAASESDDNEYRRWAHDPLGPVGRRRAVDLVDAEGGRRASTEQSPDVGDGERERERVRHIVRGFMTENGIADAATRMSPRNESPRAEWLGETERERVRLVREWVQMASQQRDARASRREERDRDVSLTDHEEGQPEHIRRDLLRLRGRQARLDLIMRIVRERQRELQGLSEHRAVSDFAHRNRIQDYFDIHGLNYDVNAILLLFISYWCHRLEGFRYRLENVVHGQTSSHSNASVSHYINESRNDQPRSHNIGGSGNDQYQPSTAAEVSNVNHDSSQISNENSEIDETTETHANAEIENHTPNDNIDWQESVTQEVAWQEDAEHGERDWQQPIEVGYSQWHEGTGEESDGNWQGNMEQEWSRGTPEEDEEDSNLIEANEEWHEDDSQENVPDWQDGHLDPARGQQSIPIRRVNGFIPPDDDNVYSMELRELLSRRSVSNLLRSEFRESLDQLIQSYIQRQGHAPLDWDLQGTIPAPSLEEDQGQQRDDPSQEQQEAISRPPLVLPPPLIPPPQPLWRSELHHNNWTRQNMHHSDIEWDMINDLRADMARLQQGMSHMQRMLEACMDMQLELQRSVRQEVSAALNRSAQEEYNWFNDEYLKHEKLDQLEVGSSSKASEHHKVDQLKNQSSSEKSTKQLDQMNSVSSSKEIATNEIIDFEIAQEELKDAIIDLFVEIHGYESNYMEESYVETI
ncbi:zinc finger CCCH domain-containing protein 13 [Cocos nucifera]|uniref:Zinc finger CCCH domain-containing protein 13 n=1 Tax=Cocos nucifera TaxID=13894 RepID=A0A8K0N955_COCNU|nr:zinc finger CCCH domain-containing protein 13 [Cocos nucifera]